MRVLLDTNILTRGAQPAHPHHRLAVSAVTRLIADEADVCLTTQVLYEFWAVATRKLAENGLDLTTAEAHQRTAELTSSFALLHDTPEVFHAWLDLVLRHDVKGKVSHDARMVAAMLVHSVGHVLTFNVADFARFSNISVLSPEQVTAA